MKKLISLFIALVIFASCRNEKTNDKTTETISKADTLTFKYDSVKVYSKNIAKTQSEFFDTAKATVKYPIFENQDVNKYIQRRVLDYFSEKDPAIISYQEIANSFIRGYDSFFEENKNTPQSWFLLIDIKVLKQSSNYIAMQYIHSDYAGGAHPNTSFSYLNFNPITNREITLDSLIKPSEMPKLLSIAESIFRKDEKLTQTEPLTEKYFFDKGKFALAQNFYVTDEGLTFSYNPYEIKAYAYGITKLVIPFSQLKEIAKPNTILTATN